MTGIQEKLFRDPLHGLIEFNKGLLGDRILLGLIDTLEFQRLRRIRQLGLAFYVYQGAEHSRFTHSIGVTALAGQMLRQLRKGYDIPEDQVFLARCAALLHDVGHAPLSHVLERHFIHGHEKWTERMILDPDSSIHQRLCEIDLLLPAMVVGLLTHRHEPRFLCHLISSQLDADRFDYLLRDSLMTGVKHGIFDLDRLIHMLNVDEGRKQLVVGERGVRPVEKYLLARHHMFRQVYQHKTVIAAEAMLSSLLKRATALAREGALATPPAGHFFHRVLAAPSMDDIALPDYVAFDDDTVWHFIKMWQHEADPVLSDLSRRLLWRDLFKTLEIEAGSDALAERLAEAGEVLARAGCDPEHYLLTSTAADTPYRPYDPDDGQPTTSIFVSDPASPKGHRDIIERSKLVKALRDEIYSITHVVFPAEAGGRRLREKLTTILRG